MCPRKLIYSITAGLIILACASLQAQAPQYNVTVLIKDAKESTATASSLNNAGDVVGYLGNENNQPSAFLYKNGIMMDLGGALGGGQSTAYDINDKSQVVGIVGNNAF